MHAFLDKYPSVLCEDLARVHKALDAYKTGTLVSMIATERRRAEK